MGRRAGLEKQARSGMGWQVSGIHMSWECMGTDQRPMTPQRTAVAARRLRGLGLGLAAQGLLMLSACAVHQPYPAAAWGPLPPAQAEDCRHFAGSYRNKGEMVGHASWYRFRRERE